MGQAPRGGDGCSRPISAARACSPSSPAVLSPSRPSQTPFQLAPFEIESRVALEGGTHNPAAPPFDFLARTFLPILERMGASVTAGLERCGFYPAGGGRITFEVAACPSLRPVTLLHRGSTHVRARGLVASLPESIAKRELGIVRERLGLERHQCRVESIEECVGPGNVLLIVIEGEPTTEIVTGFGIKGVSAEKVASDAPATRLNGGAAFDVDFDGEHVANLFATPDPQRPDPRCSSPAPVSVAGHAMMQSGAAGRQKSRPTCARTTSRSRTAVLRGRQMTDIAQQKPDFSGDWMLNRQASTLSPAAAAFQSGVMRIHHREPIFRCEAAYVANGKPVDYTFELRSDGPGLCWDGDALVSTFETQEPGGAVTICFRYELQEGGRRLRAVEQLRGGGRDQDNVWIFDRA